MTSEECNHCGWKERKKGNVDKEKNLALNFQFLNSNFDVFMYVLSGVWWMCKSIQNSNASPY